MKRLIAISAVTCALLALPATAAAGKLAFLQTPDGNVGCAIFKGDKRVKGAARCDIRTKSWATPPRPRSCELDYGFGIEVGAKKAARFVCAGDTTLSQGPRLSPGASVSRGLFTCSVVEIPQAAPATPVVGVRCLNRRTGRGFEMSAVAPSFF